VGGVKDTIADKGKLIPSENVEALIAAMQEYIQLDTQQLQSLGKNLRIRAENEFSIVNYRENYRNLVLQHTHGDK
jgi:glycosyltransferase involved in cell wall biosynthesis